LEFGSIGFEERKGKREFSEKKPSPEEKASTYIIYSTLMSIHFLWFS